MARLNDFLGALKKGGVRANQFKVHITAPKPLVIDSSIQFLARSTTLPTLTMGEIAVPYRGRQIFISGDRTYEAWEVTVISDRDQKILHAFQDWNNQIGDIGISTQRTGVGDEPIHYYGTAVVQQLDRQDGAENQPIRTYFLHQVWPTVVAGYELNFETNDALVEFPVTFRFNYMTIKKGATSEELGRHTGSSVSDGSIHDFPAS